MSTAKTIRAITRGVGVIRVLNERPSMRLGLLRTTTGLSKPTLLRILNTFEAMGWVYRYRADGSYRLASGICHLGQQVRTQNRIAEIAAPILDRLSEQTGWPSDLAVFTGHDMRVLESTRRSCLQPYNGNLLDIRLHLLLSELGKAYLAFCPDAEREAILDNLRRSSDRLDQAAHRQDWVERVLEETRLRGYGEPEPDYYRLHLGYEFDLDAIAVPVIAAERVVACINLIWMEDAEGARGIDGDRLAALQEAADAIAASLREETEAFIGG